MNHSIIDFLRTWLDSISILEPRKYQLDRHGFATDAEHLRKDFEIALAAEQADIERSQT